MQQSSGNLETSPNNNAANSSAAQPASTPQPYTPRPARDQRQRGQQPQQQTQQNKQQPMKEETRPASLVDLFARKGSDGAPNGEITLEEQIQDDPNAPVDSIDRLVKKLGLTSEQVYNIKVPMPNGAESVSIGELKDRVGELVDFETREMEFNERRITQEGEILRVQSEIRDILQLLPKEAIKPEVIQKLRSRHEATLKRERAATLEHIPEWRNEERRMQDTEGMIETLSDYGFDESFITTMHDHRAIKLLRDFYLIRKRIKSAIANVTTTKGKKTVRPSSKQKAPVNPDNTQRGNRRTGTPNQRDRIMAYLDSHDK